MKIAQVDETPGRIFRASERGQNHACVSCAEKLSKRELEQTHLFKLSKRELEQTHLFIAECSQLWIKSVQPALDKISVAEFQ